MHSHTWAHVPCTHTQECTHTHTDPTRGGGVGKQVLDISQLRGDVRPSGGWHKMSCKTSSTTVPTSTPPHTSAAWPKQTKSTGRPDFVWVICVSRSAWDDQLTNQKAILHNQPEIERKNNEWMKNFNRSPWLSAADWRNTHTHVNRAHSLTYLVTTTLCEVLAQLLFFCACWVYLCFRNPPNSDRDYRIFNVRTWSFLCMYTHSGRTHRQRDSIVLTQKHSFSCAPDGIRTSVLFESDALPTKPPQESSNHAWELKASIYFIDIIHWLDLLSREECEATRRGAYTTVCK